MPGITDPAEEYFKDGTWGWNETTEEWEKVNVVDGHLEVVSVPEAHAASHHEDGSDELDVADLGSGAVIPATDGYLATADGAGGVAWEAPAAAGLYDAYIHIVDQKADDTAGGTFTQDAWRTRDLNTELSDTANIASVVGNQITLAAGTYRARISAPAKRVDRHDARLRNITDNTTLLVGTAGQADTAAGLTTHSFILGRFTLAAPKVLEVQHYCLTTRATDGFGAYGGSSEPEIYTVVELWREIT